MKMKKLIIFIVVFMVFTLTCCNKNKTKTLEDLYNQNMNVAFPHYQTNMKLIADIVSSEYVLVEKLTEENQKRLYNLYGEELNSLILLWDSTDNSHIIAFEYDNEDAAQQKINNNLELKSTFYISNNILLCDIYPTYILYEGGYAKKGNYVLNKDETVLLYNNIDEIVIIPNGVKKIPPFSFNCNKIIKEIVCNKELESIGEYSFYGCINLMKVMLNEQIKTIGEKAFVLTYIKELIIPKNIEYIGELAMGNANVYLNTITIPKEWDKDIAIIMEKVYTINQWEYDENGHPVVKNQ